MLEVRSEDDGFLVYDLEAGEPVMRFASRREADAMVAALQIEEIHAQLGHWSLDAVPDVY
ncbi:MAG: hypothetical protein OQK79_06995 [Rhodanobacter sp.]|jgi:hypothetical protein|nr:hypothetical protein [Rhodanobacter sp.]